ncbi:hypothetical protein AN958_12768 [Leucoagaricus sp. SymC.cos]|nr:hypothetical protein AN958_12768 [Leucoagaricus sp. SymC.cos]
MCCSIVWPEPKQVGLIDSIFCNFYIPPVIFSVNTQEDGSETRICIDGKQRLTSIYRFLFGLVSFCFSTAHLSLTCSSQVYRHDHATNEKYRYQDSAFVYSKCKHQTLLPRNIDGTSLSLLLPTFLVLTLFLVRTARHGANPRGKLAVLKSPCADFIATDFECGIGEPGSARKDKVSPIEFICITPLILVWRDKISLRAMAKVMKAMRMEVRNEHVDVRMNTGVGKAMITFLKGIKPEQYEDAMSPSKEGRSEVKEELREAKIGNKRKHTAADGEDEELASASESLTPSAKRNFKMTTTTVNKVRLMGIRMAAQQHLSRDNGPNTSRTQLSLLD